ncbi:chemotaxis protein CheW [Rehaibacterium terrae]|mgnify:CR=1 FL=1|jgi:purine-binding chemotaxis protein CheW|uniref:Purine-binding chemotaxis protein CheW n=1 Tax=Rehaibacterium terrae TaxID=1341696 RepID=A0A7W8DFN9_9GAMM|nr:chemotaxis protein CheW [Rehaibacterium terrae]MBB5016623.1 purine-binding chemotaxis protein CheW [Rehaibacterium terrae]
MQAGAQDPFRYLSFRLGGNEYAVPLPTVREVCAYSTPTPLADAPDWWPGTLDWRRERVPVIDLRRYLHAGEAGAGFGPQSVLIVLDLGPQRLALAAEAVGEVLELSPSQRLPPPPGDLGFRTDHLEAVGALDGRLLMLLAVPRLLRPADLAWLQAQLAADVGGDGAGSE